MHGTYRTGAHALDSNNYKISRTEYVVQSTKYCIVRAIN